MSSVGTRRIDSRDLCCVFTLAASDPSSARLTGAFYAVAIIYCNKTHNPLARPICRFERASCAWCGYSLMNINTCLANIPLLQFHAVLVDALRNREVTSLHRGLFMRYQFKTMNMYRITLVMLKVNAPLDIKKWGRLCV